MQRDESATTFSLGAEEWMATKAWEDRTRGRRRQLLERVVFPHIGTLRIKSISSKQLLELLLLARQNNGPSVAAEAKRTLSGIFGHAIATLRIEQEPVRPIREALPPNKTQHKRPLARTELGDLLTAIFGYDRNHQTVAALQLMWLTLCRPSEAIGMTWAEIEWDEQLWRIPPSRMKMRAAHVILLPRQAIVRLRRRQAINGSEVHVFPHRDRRGHPMTEGALRQTLHQLGWSGKLSPHATRATGSTMLNELGYDRDWVERQLAHRDKDGARGSYNQATYPQNRREMMQAWADELDEFKDASVKAQAINGI